MTRKFREKFRDKFRDTNSVTDGSGTLPCRIVANRIDACRAFKSATSVWKL